ncbi:DUF3141 domain-containing protein [Microvirga sp. HBU67558]|nr:DUF3141 domain-containing protein [Microvirga sp. HBU67558]
MKTQRDELDGAFFRSPFSIYVDRSVGANARTVAILRDALMLRAKRSGELASMRLPEFLATGERLAIGLRNLYENGRLGEYWTEYIIDAIDRALLLLNTVRESGDIFLDHEAAGCPPVLFYKYDAIMDGRELPLKSNFVLLRLIPPQDVTTDPSRRPFVIVPPRAGHCVGVGAHAADSQAGVALREGHPVYLVAFRREPEQGQQLSDVAYAQAAFVREVMRRHPRAPLPAIVGNCQAGWATLVLAATNPDLTGPIVINGSPVSAVSGNIGDSSFRYIAGIFGGVWIPMFLCDLGNGIFDGAYLIQNFELLNPESRLFLKYAEIYRDVDTARESFLAREKLWGSFCLLHENEICWILENLFIGNRLARNRANLVSERQHIDLKQIRAPIVVFTSHGDNVTPPQQALNWITDVYQNEEEVRVRGQRIIYMVHNDVGHLGIFVSSRVINREFNQVATILEAIETLMPGLYEMCIKDVEEHDGCKHFSVELVSRTFKDIRALNDSYRDEIPFNAVDHTSRIQAQIYHTVARPFIRAAVTNLTAEASRSLHPKRLSRALMSSQNPMMVGVQSLAEQVRRNRARARAENPFLIAEALYVQHVEQAMIFWRDLREMIYELVFHSVWNNPLQHYLSSPSKVNARQPVLGELRSCPDVCDALDAIATGGFIEGVTRMVTLLANDRGGIRGDRLGRWSRILIQDEPFRSLPRDRLTSVIRQQTTIATFEREQAIDTLPLLLNDRQQRRRAYLLACYVLGPVAEMEPSTVDLLRQFAQVLNQPPITGDVTENPLADTRAG